VCSVTVMSTAAVMECPSFSCCKPAVLNNAIHWKICIYKWAWCNTPEDMNHQQYNCDHLRILHNTHTLVFLNFQTFYSELMLWWSASIFENIHDKIEKWRLPSEDGGMELDTAYLTELVFDVYVTVHHWYNSMKSQLDATTIILSIITISSTCFGQ